MGPRTCASAKSSELRPPSFVGSESSSAQTLVTFAQQVRSASAVFPCDRRTTGPSHLAASLVSGCQRVTRYWRQRAPWPSA
jgi:hypothetical protein